MKVKEQVKKAGVVIWKYKFEISTVVLSATLGVIIKEVLKPYELDGWAKFDDGKITITDEDVYQYIKENSTFFDRLNPRKMVELTQGAFAELAPDVKSIQKEND